MNLSDVLRSGEVLHARACVTHSRRGNVRHSFRYLTDYLLFAPACAAGPALFSRNRFNLLSVYDRDHGGVRKIGEGPAWARAQFEEAGLPCEQDITIAILTQPRLLGFWFTPVSFWLALDGDDIRAVIAEVNNTFGQRHSYLCALDGFRPIGRADTIHATKVFHVSPFQDVAGTYRFNFAVSATKFAIRIAYERGEEGLNAAMRGDLHPLTSMRALQACLQSFGGGVRVLSLIYWNAVRLKLKGAKYRPVPVAPEQDVSR